MTKWDVIIVGAGPSGLGVGALLANAGKKVLVLEKENHVGGRAFGTKYKGHFVDNGAHTPMRSGYLEEIFSRVGKPFPHLTPFYNKSEVYLNGKWQDLSSLYPHTELRKIIGRYS